MELPRTTDLLIAGAFLVESQLEVAILVGYDAPHAGVAALLLAIMAVGVARAPRGAGDLRDR